MARFFNISPSYALFPPLPSCSHFTSYLSYSVFPSHSSYSLFLSTLPLPLPLTPLLLFFPSQPSCSVLSHPSVCTLFPSYTFYSLFSSHHSYCLFPSHPPTPFSLTPRTLLTCHPSHSSPLLHPTHSSLLSLPAFFATPVVPASPPENVTLHSHSNQTAITVSWLPLSSQYYNSHELKGYCIHYEANNVRINSSGDVPVGPTTTTRILTGLHERVAYTISVAAVNAEGTGPYSSELTVTTSGHG